MVRMVVLSAEPLRCTHCRRTCVDAVYAARRARLRFELMPLVSGMHAAPLLVRETASREPTRLIARTRIARNEEETRDNKMNSHIHRDTASIVGCDVCEIATLECVNLGMPIPFVYNLHSNIARSVEWNLQYQRAH